MLENYSSPLHYTYFQINPYILLSSMRSEMKRSLFFFVTPSNIISRYSTRLNRTEIPKELLKYW